MPQFPSTLATAAFLAIFVASVLALPRLPGWTILAFLLMVPVFYKVQSWNHKIWTIAADMTELNRRFPPGRTLTGSCCSTKCPFAYITCCFGDRIGEGDGTRGTPRMMSCRWDFPSIRHIIAALIAYGPGRSRCCANP